MQFDALEDLGRDLRRLEAGEPIRRRRRWRRPAALSLLVLVGLGGTATAMHSSGADNLKRFRPASSPPADVRDPATRRSLQTFLDQVAPSPAPAWLAARYAATADGQEHLARSPPGMTIWLRGTSSGVCVYALSSDALAPGGSCGSALTEQDRRFYAAGEDWTTVGGRLIALVLDKATDVTYTSKAGVEHPGEVVNNMLVAEDAHSFAFTLDGSRKTIVVDGTGG